MGPIKLINRLVHKIADMTMFKIVGNDYTYLYNVSWEDPRIDHTVCKCTSDDHVITIASAGCNTFDYIIEGAKVTAVDLNAAQIALTDLKAAAIRTLEFSEFFRIFAKNDIQLLRSKYKDVLRPLMSPRSQQFWDAKVPSLKSFMYSGTSGVLAKFVVRVIFRVLGLGFIRRTLIENKNLNEFHEQCQRHKLRLSVMCWVIDKLISNAGLALLAGVPSRQLELGLHRKNNFVTVFKRLCDTDLVKDNYFYFGYIGGEYSEECCPRYLKEVHYQTLRDAITAGRLTLFEGTLVECLKQTKPGVKYTVASLLDHMDWMPPHMINEELHWLQQNMDQTKARIFWRSFSESVHSAPLVWLNPQRVDDSTDRVAMYWSTWIARLDGTVRYDLRTQYWSKQPKKADFFSMISTGIKIVVFPILQSFKMKRIQGSSAMSDHQSKMEAFYQSQKDEYDAFREQMLHARPVLAECMPIRQPKEGGKIVWVDVGGGTARNLEFFSVETIRANFSKIVVVDVSTSLLEVATKRVAEQGLSDIVQCIECDFCDPQAVAAKLPQTGTCDWVTFSYSLSMIPMKEAALKSAVSLLKPKGAGVLGIADFFYGGGLRASFGLGDTDGITNIFTRIYCELTRLWFKQDNVILLKQRVLDTIKSDVDMDLVPQERFRKRVPLLPMLRPWHGVLVAPTR
eukprot:CAMPEP_0113690478 /NCGR_PEP_ID=MMETSP0038_2-20120614/17813_1 /TAXON_ID=2898 /ORGANISM="Cryptomonas paramecium" /LENGTH=679 /DNA_ID=CAMNT_0000611807 /DNA_START=21 /DNA_END=2060 /DNA_ORIENTATION=- /assembly_acc=CAM_ASM_000170